MHDSPILVVNLVYAGTLGIGLLLFLGQLAAFIVLLISAATAKLLTNAIRTLILRSRELAPHRQGRHFSQVPATADTPNE
ncbi:hypothetical protein J2S98_003999 [Arthrobacter oryzae]|uniref:Uncharacterized protein n=1 Tax=Pseudarthrobacter enclensis TaxID=993070 RepID=A0ABT9RYE3_9MICC|nr:MULTISPECIES: hypothetical protein [Micrococcaceae]MDP9890082.1 hypothetical protein [Pseudarthrobacter enclensis]MDP9988810.1 hypothetical protein [Arthrobacter oryzae]